MVRYQNLITRNAGTRSGKVVLVPARVLLSSGGKVLLCKDQIIDHVMKTLKGAIEMDCRLLSPFQLLDYAFYNLTL